MCGCDATCLATCKCACHHPSCRLEIQDLTSDVEQLRADLAQRAAEAEAQTRQAAFLATENVAQRTVIESYDALVAQRDAELVHLRRQADLFADEADRLGDEVARLEGLLGEVA